jgi:hypothetical protein
MQKALGDPFGFITAGSMWRTLPRIGSWRGPLGVHNIKINKNILV